MGTLASLGAFVLPLLKMIPGIGPRLQMAAYGLLGLAVSHAAVAGWVWLRMHDANVAALATRDGEWEDKLRKAKEANDKNVAAAVSAGMLVPPTAADRAGRVRQCAESPTCRDRGRK